MVQQELARVLKEGNVALKRAVGAIGRQLDSDNGNTQLRAADMTFKLYGAYPRAMEDGQTESMSQWLDSEKKKRSIH